jgi:pyridoxamine 5'-phosphate oxidase
VEAKRPEVSGKLHKKDLAADPFAQFSLWFEEAKAKSGQPNPNAMTLCTVSPQGWPEGRQVLLKRADSAGFVFYTNLESEKGLSLKALPRAELVFHWDSLGRQVRIRGEVGLVGAAEADAYFASRPRESQLGAWASSQSQPVASVEVMNQKFHDMEQKYLGMAVPRPPYWSGFRLVPNRIEFWQADANRFHDRFRYNKEGEKWRLGRFYP